MGHEEEGIGAAASLAAGGGGGADARGAPRGKSKRKKRLRSRNRYIDEGLEHEDGDDHFADLEGFVVGDEEDLT